MADDYLNTAATVEFEMAVEFQLNELKGGFEMMSNFKGGVAGEKVEITDRFSDLKPKKIKSRFAKTELQESAIERRWIHKQERIAVHTGLDPDDQMATKIPLDSPLAMAVARGIRIGRQDEWLIAFYGSAYTGKEGTVEVPFKAGNVFAADYGETPGSYKGLTLNKLRGCRKKMIKNLAIDPEDAQKVKPHMIITAEEIEDLLMINEYISADYNPNSQSNYKPMSQQQQQALQDGIATDFMGFHFVPREITNANAYPEGAALTINGSSHRRLPVWLPAGMAGREWLMVESHRDQRPDLNHAWQFSAYTNVRYGRVHEDLCYIVECAD
jgi:hypothetical protein